jgi:hypothetical protein
MEAFAKYNAVDFHYLCEYSEHTHPKDIEAVVRENITDKYDKIYKYNEKEN